MYTLGLTLIHSLWQSLLIGGGLLFALKRRGDAKTRVRLLQGALLLLTLISLITFALLENRGEGLASRFRPAQSFVYSPTETVRTADEVVSIEGFSPASSLPEAPPLRLRILTIVGYLWLLGALFFSLLLFYRTTGISRLLHLGRPVEEPRLLAVAEQAAVRVGRSPAQLVAHPHLTSPCVAGLLRPIIFLPLSMLEGVDEEVLYTLFLHEYYHLKNHDLLADFLCGIAGALYFFNPVVWLMRKRLGIEREIRCDEAASGDRPEEYARLLFRWAKGRGVPSTAGFSEKGYLYERVKRLLGRSPLSPKPLRLGSAVLLFLVTMGLMIASCTGIRAGIDAASHWRTVEALSASPRNAVSVDLKEFSLRLYPYQYHPGEEAPSLLLQLETDQDWFSSYFLDGVFLEEGVFLYRFPEEMPEQSLLLKSIQYAVSDPRWAPIFSESIRIDSSGDLQLEDHLLSGIEGRVIVQTEEGLPVENFECGYSLSLYKSSSHSISIGGFPTDQNGVFSFRYRPEEPLRITGRIIAEGFRIHEFDFNAGEVGRITMERAPTRRIKFIDGETGNPLRRSLARLNNRFNGMTVTTDENGIAVVTFFEDFLVLETENMAGIPVFAELSVSDTVSTVALTPQYLQLKFSYPPEGLFAIAYPGYYGGSHGEGIELPEPDENGIVSLPITSPLERFELEYSGGPLLVLDREAIESGDLHTVDFDTLVSKYTLYVEAPEDFPPVEGHLQLSIDRGTGTDNYGYMDVVEIHGGVAEVFLPQDISALGVEPGNLPGYIFPPQSFSLEQLAEKVTLQAEPAGGIQGRLQFRGTEEPASVHIVLEQEPNRPDYPHTYGVLQDSFNGEYRFSSLLIGADYTLTADIGCAEPVTKHFRLLPGEPVKVLDLEFRRHPDLDIRLLDAQGRSLSRSSVEIHSSDRAGHLCHYSFSDYSGEILLANFDPDWITELELVRAGQEPIDLLALTMEEEGDRRVLYCTFPN